MLEDDKTELGIENFGISLTTLEEVFLNLASVNEKNQYESQLN